ncbi:1-phosphofructokinase family hexose kinase [uncultured Marinobacter sp.]|uniref:1-phosphofructokinase family hexose kinase n=1 Tax=uncultured Marinobacter sp. TaxID=187379 RepID=UPI00261810D1|nr:1-phosphofructokinase family hexose kinase [uncultured Marinobacter sp.]
MVDAFGKLPVAVLSLNPAVDITYEIPQLIADQKVRALKSRYDPGGNGINVGRGLKRLGVQACTFCVIAGEIGRFLRHQLDAQLDQVSYLTVDGETRINGTILESVTGAQFEVSGVGPTVSTTQWEQLLDRFVIHCGDGLGIITGSLQQSLPTDLYAEAVRRVRAAGGRAMVDSHDELLRNAIDAQPFLIKPNRFELENLVGQSLNEHQDIVREARRLHELGVTWVCVSLGAEGALLVTSSSVLKGEALRVPVASSVGAGDSMLAGMAALLAQGASPEDVLREGIACSAATVMKPGTELFDKEMVDRLRGEVKVTRLDR